jgi:hypothetical protein
MMRITTWSQNVNPPPDATPQAGIAAFNEFVAAASKVSGAGEVQWGYGHGGFVTVGFPTNYAVADAILKDPGVQAAGMKILALGIGIAEDFFVTTPQQVMPFIPRQ